MIITISGLPGSGKSTVGKMLAERLGYRFYSMGDLRGKMAMERGMTIEELNKLGEREVWTDKDVDEYQKRLGQTEDNVIIDGRLSFHFIPDAWKIFLDVDPQVGAQRVFKNQRPDELAARSVEEMERMQAERIAQDDLRYEKYYGVSFRNRSKYDLVIDASNLTPEEVVEKILTRIRR